MDNSPKSKITVSTTVNAPLEKVWQNFTLPSRIIKWYHASDDWHTTFVENDVRPDGRFLFRMEAKDGIAGFDFTGTYTKVVQNKELNFTIDDGRIAEVTFNPEGNTVKVVELFEAESLHPEELQRHGWQAILDNFRKHVESFPLTTLEFEVEIAAPAGAVYLKMLDEVHYNSWTSVFDPSSKYEGSWGKGSVIRFIGTDKSGKKAGMISRIRENIPDSFVCIEHVGIIDGDKEITDGPKVQQWKGALESYSFQSKGSTTMLKVCMDTNEQFRGFFADTWPRALQKLKELCEN